jgi:4-diphosphocytidyl-2-C-methyl-D-erythritol kinase
LLDREIGLPEGVSIALEKRIPVGAGLGGGSSDAAATLKGLNHLFKLGLQSLELAALAEKLGSDVTLFFSTGQCLITGRGEVVETVKLPTDYSVLLILPDFPISTAWAYRQLRFPLTRRIARPTFMIENTDSRRFYKSLTDIGNDFVDIIVHEHPQVETVMSRLRLAGASVVQLSGSGSAFFGLFEREPDVDVNALFGNRIGWKALILNPVCIEPSHTY